MIILGSIVLKILNKLNVGFYMNDKGENVGKSGFVFRTEASR